MVLKCLWETWFEDVFLEFIVENNYSSTVCRLDAYISPKTVQPFLSQWPSYPLFSSESPTLDPKKPSNNITLSPLEKEEEARLQKKALANAVHYIWETGEDKYMLRYFHTGFWLSCEAHNEGEHWVFIQAIVWVCFTFIEMGVK